MSWAEDKAKELAHRWRGHVDDRYLLVVKHAIRETIEKCADVAYDKLWDSSNPVLAARVEEAIKALLGQ